ncbi:MAG: hypothetical protein M3O92_05800 [Actinomycetota bacterium]|nr:hypothetical protein [Actinomycetota bacterium]
MPNVSGRVDVKKVTASHAQGWDQALDRALASASRLGQKGTFDVNVEFSATIRVTNPGQIQRYIVTLSPKG